MYDFQLPLENFYKSIAYYEKDENGEEQLRFEPPVYQQRYSTVLNILKHPKWESEISKVLNLETCMNRIIFMFFLLPFILR